ncbi:MAG: hypothetical protein IGS03_02020 [Candidatus Sericytochromatia bacterium]|nr:hypothetical protein [Candidatus Sericytochromatia bacterium]
MELSTQDLQALRPILAGTATLAESQAFAHKWFLTDELAQVDLSSPETIKNALSRSLIEEFQQADLQLAQPSLNFDATTYNAYIDKMFADYQPDLSSTP